MIRKRFALWLAAALVGILAQGAGDSLSLRVRGVSPTGVVWVPAPRPIPAGAGIAVEVLGQRLAGQHVPSQRHNGWLAVRLPEPLVARSQQTPLDLGIRIVPGQAAAFEPQPRIDIRTPAYSLIQQTDRQAGFPSRIEFPSGRVVNTTWGERLFDRGSATAGNVEKGVWGAASDKQAELTLVSDGPVCTVVRQTVHFLRDGSAPQGKPVGTYQWVFFKLDAGLVYLEATFEQETPRPWSELHFGEVHVDDASLPEWYGSNKLAAAPAHGSVADGKKISRLKAWGALANGRDFIAMHDPGVRLYADQESKRIYLHAASDQAWKPWNGETLTRSTRLQIGTAAESVEKSVQAVGDSLQAQYTSWRNADPDWRTSITNAARCYGRDNADRQVHTRQSADLAVALGRYPNGNGHSLAIDAVVAKADGALLAEQSQDLFQIEIENLQSKTRYTLGSQSPWGRVEVNASELVFQNPLGVPQAEALTVKASLAADEGRSGMRWQLAVTPGSDHWRVHSANVASLKLEAIGTKSHALFPGGEGTVIHDPNRSRAQLSTIYPSIGAVMAWMAVWDDDRAGGFYLGAHDPTGAVKRLSLRNADQTSQLEMSVTHELPFLPDAPGKTVTTPGQIVWQAFDGDWYDAAKLYRDWVRRHATWYPPMGPEGRRTTPLWLKQLCVWARVFGEAKRVVPQAKHFHEVMGVPCGFHWYVWHHNPFDNDYPNYFPAKPGFEEGVKAIQALGCYAMPYTNGRLWDTRDRGAEDWQFTAVGSKGVCRRADGKMVTESYRSKETDGSKVVFGVMCPASDTWQKKVAENDCRLINEVGLNGVYMDQIAAGRPILCEAASHGHPLGGGAWWVAGYKKMLQDIRKRIPADRIMASECNAETYVDLLDAMVCWHIEGQDVVPAYSLIYSGVVFRYGRAYDNNWRAMRMKWANNLVNGDTPGWFSPQFADKPQMAEYLLPLVHFRHQAIQYFYLGELSRPPKLLDEVPVWTENWNIFGRHADNAMPVVQTALRRIVDYEYDADGKRLWDTGKVRSALLILTNFGTEDAETALQIDWQELGIDPAKATAHRLSSSGERTPFDMGKLNGKLPFPAAETWGIEIVPEKQ